MGSVVILTTCSSVKSCIQSITHSSHTWRTTHRPTTDTSVHVSTTHNPTRPFLSRRHSTHKSHRQTRHHVYHHKLRPPSQYDLLNTRYVCPSRRVLSGTYVVCTRKKHAMPITAYGLKVSFPRSNTGPGHIPRTSATPNPTKHTHRHTRLSPRMLY